jgi:hypothetical protein
MDSKKLVFGLYGTARSGKDTVANYLQTLGDFHIYGFADPMYRMLQAGFGLILQNNQRPSNYVDMASVDVPIYPVNEDDKERVIRPFGVSLRYMMQTLGTEWGRLMVCDDLWVHMADVWYHSRYRRNVIFKDIRHANEADFVKGLGGVIVFIDRSVDHKVRKHSSEDMSELHGFRDWTIYNDSTTDALYKSIDDMLRRYGVSF